MGRIEILCGILVLPDENGKSIHLDQMVWYASCATPIVQHITRRLSESKPIQDSRAELVVNGVHLVTSAQSLGKLEVILVREWRSTRRCAAEPVYDLAAKGFSLRMWHD
jgi:hypothetical protein